MLRFEARLREIACRPATLFWEISSFLVRHAGETLGEREKNALIEGTGPTIAGSRRTGRVSYVLGSPFLTELWASLGAVKACGQTCS